MTQEETEMVDVSDSGNQVSEEHLYSREAGTKSICTQTVKSTTDIEGIEYANKLLREEVYVLRATFDSLSLDINYFMNNDVKTEAYTPLKKWKSLDCLYKKIESKIQLGSHLGKFQMLLLILMRLKSNLPTSYLASIFQISETTVNRLILLMLPLLYQELKSYIRPVFDISNDDLPIPLQPYVDKKCIALDFLEFEANPAYYNGMVACQESRNAKLGRVLLGITLKGNIVVLSPWMSCEKSLADHLKNELFQNLPYGCLVVSKHKLNHSHFFFSVINKINLENSNQIEDNYTFLETNVEIQDSEMNKYVKYVIKHATSIQFRRNFEILNFHISYPSVVHVENDVKLIDKIVAVCCALNNINLSGF